MDIGQPSREATQNGWRARYAEDEKEASLSPNRLGLSSAQPHSSPAPTQSWDLGALRSG